MYSKKYDISAYGRTKREARFMFTEAISDILIYTKPQQIKVKNK